MYLVVHDTVRESSCPVFHLRYLSFLFLLPLSRPFATPSSNCPVLAVRVTLPCFLRDYSLELECQSVNGKPSNLQLATARLTVLQQFSIFPSYRHVLPNKRLRLRKVNAPNNGYTFPSSTIRFGITLKYCNISIISNSEIFHPKVYEKIVYIPIEHRSFQRKYGGVSYIVKSNTIRIKSVSQLTTNIYKSISSKEKFGKRQEKNRTRM